MDKTQRAIFLTKIRFRDSGFVLRVLNEEGAIEAFLFQGTKGSKKGMLAQLFPLNEIEIESSSSAKSSLPRVKNVKALETRMSIRSAIEKSALSFFIAELISKSLKENDNHPNLYEFVSSAIDVLDHQYKPTFHLVFMLRLAGYLGFQPQLGHEKNAQFFDLLEGQFTVLRPMHVNYADTFESKKISRLMEEGFSFPGQYTKDERARILELLLRYYQLHIEGFGGLKSVSVLQELFD